jgi:hypothetical protein
MEIEKYKVPPSIESIIDSILANISNKPEYISIFYNWRRVVGNHYHSLSAPYRVLTYGKKKILLLKVKKGYALEIQYNSFNILGLVHKFLGKTYFSGIKVLQMDHC